MIQNLMIVRHTNLKVPSYLLFNLFLVISMAVHLMNPASVGAGVYMRGLQDISDEQNTVLITREQKQRILRGAGRVRGASLDMDRLESLKSSSGYNDENWDQFLLENSVHTFITGDPESRQVALNVMRSHVTYGDIYRFDKVQPWRNGRPFDHSTYCNSMALSYDLLKPYMTPYEDRKYRSVLSGWAYGIDTWMNLKNPKTNKTNAENYLIGSLNWNAGMASCLGNIALELDDHPDSQEWLSTAKTVIHNTFKLGFNPQGDYIEGHGYQGYATGQSLIFAHALRNTTGEDLLEGTGAANIWNYFTYAYMSDGNLPVYGDNTYETMIYGDYLYPLYREVESDDKDVSLSARYHLWTWNKIRGVNGNKNIPRWVTVFDKIAYILWYPGDIEPQSPLEAGIRTAEFFPSAETDEQPIPDGVRPGGMYVLRSGWDPRKSISLWLVNRWRSQVHQHYDPNSYTLSAYGVPLITDNEYKIGYRSDYRGRLSNKNAVVVDDWFDRGVGSSISSSSLGITKNMLSSNVADIVESDAKYPYNHFMNRQYIVPKNGLLQPSIEDVVPLKKAMKTIIVPKDIFPGVIMLDEIDPGDGRYHDFKWLMHYPRTSTNVSTDTTDYSSRIQYSVKDVDMQVDILLPGTCKTTPKENYNGEDHADKLFVVAPRRYQHDVNFLAILSPGIEHANYRRYENILSENHHGYYRWEYLIQKTKSSPVDHIVIIYNPDGSVRRYGTDAVNDQYIVSDAKLLIFRDRAEWTKDDFILVDASQLQIDGEDYSVPLTVINAPIKLTATVSPGKLYMREVYRPDISVSSPKSIEAQLLRVIRSNRDIIVDTRKVDFFPRQQESDVLDPPTGEPLLKSLVKPGEGDFNKDGYVRMDDLSLLVNAIHSADTDYDLNGDGRTNIQDVNEWLTLYSR